MVVLGILLILGQCPDGIKQRGQKRRSVLHAPVRGVEAVTHQSRHGGTHVALGGAGIDLRQVVDRGFVAKANGIGSFLEGGATHRLLNDRERFGKADVLGFCNGFGEPSALHEAALGGCHQLRDRVRFRNSDASIDRKLKDPGGRGAATTCLLLRGSSETGKSAQATAYMAT